MIIYRKSYDKFGVKTVMQYDNYGNCIRIEYPNHSYSYTYDNEVHSYPISVRDTFGHTSYAQDYDFRFGVPRTLIDKHGSRMEYTLDAWGRILTIRGPKEIDSSVLYTIRYQYNRTVLNSNGTIEQPASTFTFNYDPAHPGNDIEIYTYSDGLGRVVQTKKDADVNGVEQKVISGRVKYDALGRAVKNYYPTTQALGDTTYYTGVDGVAPSSTQYDILDRPLIQQAPDGTEVSYKYGFGTDSLRSFTLFETEVTDQNGHISTSLANVNKQQYEVRPAGHQPVWFDYNDVGDLLTVWGVDFARSYLYDGIGRKTEYTEDSLKETYVYDGTNLIEKKSYWNERGQTQHKTISYTYDFNRLTTVQSSEYQDAIEYTYNSKGKLDTIKDASGIQLFTYGSMGEVTNQTRIYTLPFMEQAVKIETLFEYDSWGRTLSMTYPDGEKLTYEYDCGGQLRKMQGVKDTLQYNYLENIKYDKFGAKTLVKYGNNLTTTYSYNPQNLRLSSQNIAKTVIDYLHVSYSYDPKGNITGINTTNYTLPDFSAEQTFAYDAADQLDSASGNNGSLYTVKMSYGNYGRVNTYNTTFTDPQTSISTQLSNNYTYNVNNPASNSFAPVSANNGDIAFEYGINGSMRKKISIDKTEYYLFNSFDQMKAYSDNKETYGYYGYDDAGQRMYKATLNNFEERINALGNNVLEVEKLMLYPNGYININQDGNYTKHYYAEDARIASKIGSGYEASITAGTDSLKMVEALEVMQKELGEVTNDTVGIINYSFGQITHLQGDSCEYEEGLYFYHGNHLSSTQLITDMYGSVTQAVLYGPWGNIISEYRQDWMLDTIPRYLFQGKERDEESGMDYFEARYYSSDDIVFRGRDPKFEKYFWLSPYCAFANNPVIYIDPDGKKFVVPKVKIEGQKGRYNVTFDGTTATMQQGRKGEVKQYQSGTNKFVDNMIAAYNYITNCDGADVDGAMQTMAQSDTKIKVKYQRNGGSYNGNKTIYFDFSQGEKIERDDGVSGYESPAVGFWSEVYHSYLGLIDKDTKNSLFSLGDTYNMKEENYVHVTKGNQVIDALNNCYGSTETKRNHYDDAKMEVKMKNVIDTNIE